MAWNSSRARSTQNTSDRVSATWVPASRANDVAWRIAALVAGRSHR